MLPSRGDRHVTITGRGRPATPRHGHRLSRGRHMPAVASRGSASAPKPVWLQHAQGCIHEPGIALHGRRGGGGFDGRLRERAGHRHGIGEAAYEALLVYPFPGNMRELRNILDRAMAMARGARLEIQHLPAEVTRRELVPAVHPVHAENDFVACADHELDEAEHLREVLHKHRGNRRLTAQELGITERTLYRRLKAHGIEQ